MSGKRRPSIGLDPLDSLIPTRPQEAIEPPQKVQAVASPVKEAKTTVKKTRATFHITEELFEEARDAAVQLAGPPARLTLSEIVENGIRAELERLKKKYNEGKPFDKREGNLKGGRPIGS